MSSEMTVLFCDGHFVVAVKPAGVPAQPDPSETPDFLTLLADRIRADEELKVLPTLYPVLRLDRPVGGVTLVARSPQAHAKLDQLIRERAITKRYLVLYSGSLPETTGELRHWLFKIEKLNFSKVVKEGKPGSKEALLRYRVLGTHNNLSLAEAELVTGRHHQIRAQFSEAGCPLWGDRKYGRWPREIRGFGLWAWKLDFVHPFTGEMVVAESLPPMDADPWNRFAQLLQGRPHNLGK
jgi:23S rRNA pseudouridine1911/1915/1917 synthase